MRRRKRGRGVDASALDRFSEPFPPHGALAAEGAENLLGRPRLDPLVVLVREAVQNSWDARQHPGGTIRFGVHLQALDDDALGFIRHEVFADVPRAVHRVREVLSRPKMSLLSLTDSRTVGLGGPIRADQPPRAGQPSNFVDLLFNIGQPAERELAGGTYGFGRTISFVVSEARAVVVYSRTKVGRTRESRLIAAAFSEHFTEGRRRFTGRHWWGRASEGSIEPVVGEMADEIARSMGLRAFGYDQCGTTICVVAPDLRGRAPMQACNFLAGALVWNFWPKMLDHGNGPAIEFTVALDDTAVPVPPPEELPPLPAFVTSLRALHASDPSSFPGATVHDVVHDRTGERIGRLALTRNDIQPRPVRDEGESEVDERGSSAGFDGPSHHVALMRQPELVVQYLPVAELGSVSSEYAGVFKPEKPVDRAFARAEPPTHDAWHPQLVPETKLRRFVAVALRTVRDETSRFVELADARSERSDVGPLVRVLDSLFSPAPGSRRQAPRQLPVAVVTAVRTDRVGVHNVSTVEFAVEHASGTSGTTVEARAHAATHDGWTAERDRVDGPAGPVVAVLGFRSGDSAVEGAHIAIDHDASGPWSLRVRSDPAVAITVDLVTRAEVVSE